SSAPDIADWHVLQSAAAATSARAFRLRRAPPAAFGLRSARNRHAGTRALVVATEVDRGDEQQGEENITKQRVPEEHPPWRSTVLRQPDGERLKQTGQVFGISRIAPPGEQIR